MKDTVTTSPQHQEHSLRRIGLVLTGGTIGAIEENGIVSKSASQTKSETDLIESIRASEVDVVSRSPLRKLSENVGPRDWVTIADEIRDLATDQDIDGVIVLHGTDTMAYTAAALNFLLTDVEVPVVLTGSNLPSSQYGSDAPENVGDAFLALPHLGRGAYVVFAGGHRLSGHVYLGTRVRKMRTSKNAFESINRRAVGEIVAEKYRSVEPYKAPPLKGDTFSPTVDERVLALRLYPGLDLDALFAAVANSDIRGVVIDLYASATGPAGPDADNRLSIPEFVRKCVARDVIIATTVDAAPVINKYETTLAIEGAGALFLSDMLPETAIVKLMWALAQHGEADAVRQLMLQSIAGEIDAATIGS
jgi:L-asparaginase type I